MWGRKKSRRRTQEETIRWHRHLLAMWAGGVFAVIALIFVVVVMSFYLGSLFRGEQTTTLAHMSDLMAGLFKVVATSVGL